MNSTISIEHSEMNNSLRIIHSRFYSFEFMPYIILNIIAVISGLFGNNFLK